MQIERERFLGAGSYERTTGRQGYANCYKLNRIDSLAATVTVRVPQTAAHMVSRSIRNLWCGAVGRGTL